jgi:hypothetical protein
VHFGTPADGEGVYAGEIVSVRVRDAAPHWLRGELLERVRPAPRRRVRLPVTVV